MHEQLLLDSLRKKRLGNVLERLLRLVQNYSRLKDWFEGCMSVQSVSSALGKSFAL